MVGARSAKRACLCFFLFCILAPNGAASHELAEGGEQEVGHQRPGQELGEQNEGGEGGDEKETEEHDKEEEEKESLSAYSMGLTMLGMLVLLTFLYHLTHANRLETREISWKMLSGTISIFVGVVVYTAINSVFERLVMTNLLNIHKDDPKDQVWFKWVNRLWVVFFYGLFILSTSAKARIGPFGGLKARLRLLGEEQARLARQAVTTEMQVTMQAVNTEMQASRARSSTTELKERPIGVLLKDLHVEGQWRSLVALFRKTSLLEQAEHEGEESKGSKAGFRAAVNYMKCSLFWAHAIGFAGIDGWNQTQQEACPEHAEGMYWPCVWKSLWILGRATLQYYVMVRLLGIGWRFAMKKFIHPKCWVIVYHKDEQHDMVLKDQKGIFDKTEWPENEWIPFVQQSEEEAEESEVEEEKKEKPEKQEFQLEWRDNGKYRFKYEGTGEDNKPEQYFTRKIGGKLIHEFDAPWNFFVYQYKVGEDEKDGKQGTYYAVPEHDELIEEWDDIRKDGENDFYALMLSFIVVQTMRLAVSGWLPNKDEDEHLFPNSERGGHTPYEVLILYGISVAFLAVAWKVYATLVRIRSNPFFCDQTKYEQAKDIREKIIAAPEFVAYKIIECIHRVELPIMRDELHGSLERILDVFVTVLCMSASWGMMYGTQWLLAMLKHITKEDENVLDVCLAISVTFSMFLLLQMADLWFACGCCKKAAYEQSQRALKGVKEPLISDTPSAKWRRKSQQTKEFEEKQEKIAKSHKGAFAKVNTSVGLLIGFSWEANFDKAIDNIAEALAFGSDKTSIERSEIIIKVLCAAVFVSLLVPVWKIQISPMTEEQGFKFGFIPRLLHARFAEIEKDMIALQSPLQGGDPERAERAQQTKKHIQEHEWHLNAIRDHLTHWNPKSQPHIEHTLSQPVQHRDFTLPIEAPKHAASVPEYQHGSNST